jgi:ankyrin repeat protein
MLKLKGEYTMKKHYFEEVQKLVDEKLSKQTNKERLELLRIEMEKPIPSVKTVEDLLKFGVGKKIELSKILKEIENKRKGENPYTEIKFKEFVSELHADKNGKVSKEVIQKLKDFLIKKELLLDVNAYTKKGICLIHVAVGMGDAELAQMLIDRGADLNTNGRDESWRLPQNWVTDIKESQDVIQLIKKQLQPHS